MNKQVVKLALGAVVVFGGSELGLSLVEGRVASIPQLIGVVILLFVLYAVMPQNTPTE